MILDNLNIIQLSNYVSSVSWPDMHMHAANAPTYISNIPTWCMVWPIRQVYVR